MNLLHYTDKRKLHAAFVYLSTIIKFVDSCKGFQLSVFISSFYIFIQDETLQGSAVWARFITKGG